MLRLETEGAAAALAGELDPALRPRLTDRWAERRPVLEEADYPLTLALPLSLGLSVSDYYKEAGPDGRDQTFGFFDVGLAASVPLSFMLRVLTRLDASALHR